MKILYVTQYYRVASEPGSLRHSAHARYLVSHGHSVTVISTYVLHKQEGIHPEYRNGRVVHEMVEGVNVIKVRSSATFGSFAGRMRNYISFMFNAIWAGILTKGKYDVVLASSPSLFVGWAGWLLSVVKRARYVLEVRDLWPQSAIALGVLRNRYLIALSRALEGHLYRRASKIVAVTRGIAEQIQSEISDPAKIHVVPNGIDAELFENLECERDIVLPEPARKPLVVMYAGAHGVNNSLDLAISAAALLRDDGDIVFVLIGRGDQTGAMRTRCEIENIPNVVFLGIQPRRSVPEYLACADVLLWPVAWDASNRALLELKQGALPNKLLDYLAAGRPVVATAPPDSEGAKLLLQYSAGIVVTPDPQAISTAIRHLKSDVRRSYLGTKGEDAIRELSRERMAGLLEGALRQDMRAK